MHYAYKQHEYAVNALRLTAHFTHSACILMNLHYLTSRYLSLDTHSSPIYNFTQAGRNTKSAHTFINSTQAKIHSSSLVDVECL